MMTLPLLSSEDLIMHKLLYRKHIVHKNGDYLKKIIPTHSLIKLIIRYRKSH